jgi:hypothetical protein
MQRILAAVALAGALLAGQVGLAAASYELPPSSQPAYHPSRHSYGLTSTTSVQTCWYAYWIAEARNAIGTVLFRYKEEVDWCVRSGKITWASRWTQPTTVIGLLWQYAGESLFEPAYNSTHTSATFTARGTFNQIVPTIFGFVLVGQSHPRVSIAITGSGTASGSIGWS